MKYLSVCSGIEAATVAWHPLGWQAVGFSEIDNFARAVLEHHYPDIPLHGDFTELEAKDYDAIDLLVGGTPCQSFSVAGLRRGLADERGNLALEFIRLAQKSHARWLVWENVPGVLSHDGGRTFATFLGALAKCGYGFAYRVLDAQYFGVPQRRRRVFVIGYFGDWRPAAAVLFERESLLGDITPCRKAGQEAAATLTAGFGERGIDGEQITNGNYAIRTTASGKSIFGTLMANCGKKQWLGDQEALTGDYHIIEPKNAIPIHSQAFRCSRGGKGRNGDGRGNGLGIGNVGDPANTITRTEQHAVAFAFDSLNSNSMKSANPSSGCREVDVAKCLDRSRPDPSKNQGGNAVLAFVDVYNQAIDGEVAATLSAATGIANASGPKLLSKAQVRRLTPRECERLQGFPDDYTLIPYRGKHAPDGNRYKALGNSMAVPVMHWLGMRIEKIEQMLKSQEG